MNVIHYSISIRKVVGVNKKAKNLCECSTAVKSTSKPSFCLLLKGEETIGFILQCGLAGFYNSKNNTIVNLAERQKVVSEFTPLPLLTFFTCDTDFQDFGLGFLKSKAENLL